MVTLGRLRDIDCTMHRLGLVLCFMLAALRSLGQCADPSFSVQGAACLGEEIVIDHTPGAYQYSWDFCSGDLAGVPDGSNVLNSANFNNARSLRIIKEGGQFYGFVTNANQTGGLFRLDFGADLSSSPTMTSVGSAFGISGSQGFDMYSEGGIWYALVANAGSSVKNVTRLKFSNGLTQAPESSVVNAGSTVTTSGANFIRIVRDGSNLFGFVTVSPNKLVRLNFGSSLENLSPSVDEITITGVNELRGIDFVRECDEWIAIAVGASSTAVYRLTFGADLTSTPSVQSLATTPALAGPGNVEVVNEGGSYYAFIQNRRSDANAAFYRIKFGDSMLNAIESTEEFKPEEISGVEAANYALEMYNEESVWYYFTINTDTRNLVRIDFPNDCGADPVVWEGDIPPSIHYNSPGNHQITLRATDANGNHAYTTASVVVSSDMAPEVSMTSENLCALHDVNFTADGTDLITYVWDFGDASSSKDPAPTHIYASSGIYSVTLEVAGSNGCSNRTSSAIEIFDPPVAGFIVPALDPICTHQSLTFENQTEVNADVVTYEWYVNDVLEATSEDLEITFTTTDPREIRLVASLPGCSDEAIESIDEISAGPQLDFSLTGVCEQEEFTFTAQANEPVFNYGWDFDDGGTSADENPTHIFADAGIYYVTFSAESAGGCNAWITKDVQVFAVPTVDFELSGYACTNASSAFTDLTTDPDDSDIVSWQWDFGDESGEGAVERNPVHQYTATGQYLVSLTVETNVGCTADHQETIDVLESPVAQLTVGLICPNSPSVFEATGDDIASFVWDIDGSNYTSATAVHTFVDSGPELVKLVISGNNECVVTYDTTVTVPEQLVPEFSYTVNCAGHETLFVDNTIGSENVIQYEWVFEEADAVTGPSVGWTFDSHGAKSIRYVVTDESGCRYESEETIDVLLPPNASFQIEPQLGFAPLTVTFTNTSTDADHSLWNFGDGSGEIADHSPQHDFVSPGLYSVQLTIANDEGCIDSVSMPVIVVEYFDEPSFSVQPDACLKESIVVSHSPTVGLAYDWDFCSGDLARTPTANIAVNNSNFVNVRSLRIVEDNGQFYGMAINGNQAGSLLRLEFGTDLTSAPTVTVVGSNLGISGASGFDLYREGETWFALVANSGSTLRNVTLLKFTNGLAAIPETSVIAAGTTAETLGANFVKIVKDGENVYGFVTVGPDKLVRLSFGSSLENPTPAIEEFSIPGASEPRGIDFVRDSDQWVALLVDPVANALYKLFFGNNLDNQPLVAALPTTPALSQPVNVKIANDGGIYYAFIQNRRSGTAAAFYRVTFGATVLDSIQTTEEFKPAEISATGASNFALEMYDDESSWYYFTINTGTRDLVRVDFPNECGAEPMTWSGDVPPFVQYNVPGTHRITLRATDANGNHTYGTASVSVASDVAPGVSIASENICALHDVNFTAVGTGFSTYDWDFGDAGTSTEPAPSHVYPSAGVYSITLEVTADNGCANRTASTIEIYDPPVSGFAAPAFDPVCTNQVLVFDNETEGVADELIYEWYIDDVLASTSEDLEVALITTEPKEIRLVASIPGCADEAIHLIKDVFEGPQLDFSVVGICEQEAITFVAESNVPVFNHRWQFGDGSDSDDVTPVHHFSSEGVYEVTLSTSSANGCVTIVNKEVTISDKPEPAFEWLGPPSGCSGAETVFMNTTNPMGDGSTIDSWTWSFGDPDQTISLEENATHFYHDAGQYLVSLTAETSAGCVGKIEQLVDILPSPGATISATPACVGGSAVFMAVGDDIVSWYWETGTSFGDAQLFTHTFHTAGDYDLYLSVVATNGCISNYDTVVSVPEPLVPDFEFTGNCVGNETSFDDRTEGDDLVVARTWLFDGSVISDEQSFNFAFNSIGEKTIGLVIETISGCTYSVEKTINVVEPPDAAFTASTQSGGIPLSVTFINRSENTSRWLWKFGDDSGGESIEHSPEFTFTKVGEYIVELNVMNDEGCTDVAFATISALQPLPDVALRLLTVDDNGDGTHKVIVTLENRGNTVIENLPLTIDLSGYTSLTEIIAQPIRPAGLRNFVATYNIDAAHLSFLCASANLAGDVNTDNDRACVELQNRPAFFEPYPNPVVDRLTVEWVSPADGACSIFLTDSFGRKVFESTADATKGLNTLTLDLSTQTAGIYHLIIFTGSGKLHRRIVLAR